MVLRHIKAFGENFDIEVSRDGNKIQITISNENKLIFYKNISEGASTEFAF